MIEYVLLLLFLVLGGITVFLIYDYINYRKKTAADLIETRTALTTQDQDLAEQVNTNMDQMHSSFSGNQTSIASNVAMLSYQVGMTNASMCNLNGSMMFGSPPTSNNFVQNSNLGTNFIQQMSVLGGMTIRDLDKSNPMKYCFKSTGQCISLPNSNNDFALNMPMDFGVQTSNIWFDGAVTVASTKDFTFRDTKGSSNIYASMALNPTASNAFEVYSKQSMSLAAASPIWAKPGLKTNKINFASSSGVSASDNISLQYVNDGAAVVMGGSNSTLYLTNSPVSPTDTVTSPILKIQYSKNAANNMQLVLTSTSDLTLNASNVNISGNLNVSSNIDIGGNVYQATYQRDLPRIT